MPGSTMPFSEQARHVTTQTLNPEPTIQGSLLPGRGILRELVEKSPELASRVLGGLGSRGLGFRVGGFRV